MTQHVYNLIFDEEYDETTDKVTVTIRARVVDTTGTNDASSKLPDVTGIYVVEDLDDIHPNMGEYIENAIHNYWVLADGIGDLIE